VTSNVKQFFSSKSDKYCETDGVLVKDSKIEIIGKFVKDSKLEIIGKFNVEKNYFFKLKCIECINLNTKFL